VERLCDGDRRGYHQAFGRTRPHAPLEQVRPECLIAWWAGRLADAYEQMDATAADFSVRASPPAASV
jgi:hypothetical protein